MGGCKGRQVRDGGTEGREELKEETAARNVTDGCGRLSLVSLPGGCASAQVEMGQMEGCVFVCEERGNRHTRPHTYTDFLEEEAVGSHAQMLCQRHPAHAL